MNDTDLLIDIYYTKKKYDGLENLYKKAKITNKNITRAFVKELLSNKINLHNKKFINLQKRKYFYQYIQIRRFHFKLI